jgi:DNA-binding NtrC family response regulator
VLDTFRGMNNIRKDTQSWCASLRSPGDLAGTVTRFAQALSEAAGARTVGVFLLDYTGQTLLLFASWSKEAGLLRHDRQAIPMDMLHDPLCFSLQEGKPYHAAMVIGLPPFPSLALLPGHAEVRGLIAAPLLTWNNAVIGGVLLGFGNGPPDLAPETSMLVDFGSVLLDGIIRQQKDHVLLNSLREDILRLDAQRHAREQAANTLLVGRSKEMMYVRNRIAKAGNSDVPVLITGETGTGKELAATAIHAASPRSAAPFVTINCGALPAPLLESELFGHKKGAFSGAAGDHIGLFRSAAGGTVLLDEVGEMPLALQVKLLRVVQDHQVRPVGAVRSFPVDIRILSATNIDLEKAVNANTFRRDLFHRLQGLRIHLPPLRQRVDDIPLLISYFLQKKASGDNRPAMTCHPDAMQFFLSRPFPGNVRQLFAELEEAALNAGEAFEILAEHCSPQQQAMGGAGGKTLQEHLAAYENMLIESVISNYNGNITRAAQALGVPRTTLSSKLGKIQRAGESPIDPPVVNQVKNINDPEQLWTSC